MTDTHLILILLATQVLDAATTLRFLSKGGREANPVIRNLGEALGYKPTFAIKTAFVMAIGHWLLTTGNQGLVAALALFYLAVGIWNIRYTSKLPK